MASRFAKRTMVGERGTYQLGGIVASRRPPAAPIQFAKSGSEFFALKECSEETLSNYKENLSPYIPPSPFVRLLHDVIYEQPSPFLVYKYMQEDLFSLARRWLPRKVKKSVLKSVLEGLKSLHENDIFHLDITPHNILIDLSGQEKQELIVEDVKIIDLESSAHCPPGSCVEGQLVGSEDWRSPEGHLKSRLGKPTDIFAFGAVCIYVMLGKVAFEEDHAYRVYAEGGFPLPLIRLQRMVFYFGDWDGLRGLATYVGSDFPITFWDHKVRELAPYEEFSKWPDVDPFFVNFISRLMNLDPAQRMTAQDALEHPWFDVD